MAERFWAHVEKSDGCWEWTAYRDRKGYGKFGVNGDPQLAHRVAWVLTGHTLPSLGLELDHLCRNPACVNPAHLEPVTHKVNLERSLPAQQTHCRSGHAYDALNTYIRPNGNRDCRRCTVDRQRRYRERKAA